MRINCCCCGRYQTPNKNVLSVENTDYDGVHFKMPLCLDCNATGGGPSCGCGDDWDICRNKIARGNYGNHKHCRYVVKKPTADQMKQSHQNLKEIEALEI